jgi:AraC-like DNA-binding protein
MSTEQNPTESAKIIQKDDEILISVPDGAEEPTRRQPKRKYGEQTVTGIIVGQGDNKRVIRIEDVKSLAELHLTYKDMASYFGCKESTFKDHFHQEVEMGRQRTKQRLMNAMLYNAIDKHQPTIQIWMSKNLLGWTDAPINKDDTQVLPWLDEEPDVS